MAKIAAVYGGSSPQAGTPAYEDARRLGSLLAREGWTVASGGYTGVMAAVSQGACEADGHVVGVTCELIETWKGIRPNPWVKEEIKFATMRERLYHIVAFCDAALALPGGIGTLSEIALTWSLLQTGEIPPKPLIAIGRVWGATLTTFIQEADGYLHPGDDQILRISGTIEEALELIRKH